MKTLVIDNHDSFTYNLVQMIAEVNGAEPTVVTNSEAGWADLAALDFDNIVISPGPGRPERTRDFGVCRQAIEQSTKPLLGVCLGHQGLAHVWGSQVVTAPEPMHGRLARIHHDGEDLFHGLPREFEVVRYHSLIVREPLPSSLEPSAWTGDGTLMALRHRERPQWGVQFHPESIATEYGAELLRNFRDLTAGRRGQ
jgi:para-aminobenzoate synthetase